MIELNDLEKLKPLLLQGSNNFTEQREKAWDAFAVQGFPSKKNEAWKYTDLRPLQKESFNIPLSPSNMDEEIRALVEKNRLENHQLVVFVDGHFDANLSEMDWLRSSQTEEKISLFSDHPLIHFNAAGHREGLLIEIESKEKRAPIQILHMNLGPNLSQYRNIIRIGELSEVTVTETFVSTGKQPSFHNVVTEIYMDKSSQLHHTRISNEGSHHYHVGHVEVRQGKDSTYRLFHFSKGSKLQRESLQLDITAEGAETELNGFYLGKGNELVDHTLNLKHSKPHSLSKQLYKGILTGKSRGVFNGKVIVAEGASGTHASQLNKTLLLSNTSIMGTRPRLEILNDDVKCTHGATVGQLEAEELFYLQTRGFSKVDAQKILSRAFVQGIVDAHPLTECREWVNQSLLDPFFREALA